MQIGRRPHGALSNKTVKSWKAFKRRLFCDAEATIHKEGIPLTNKYVPDNTEPAFKEWKPQRIRGEIDRNSLATESPRCPSIPWVQEDIPSKEAQD